MRPILLLAALVAVSACTNPTSGDDGGGAGGAPGGSGGGGGGGVGGATGGSGGEGGVAGGGGGGCVPDCAGRFCGSDGCEGTCGDCPPGVACLPEGLCERECVADCAGRECGSDGCDGDCGTCAPDALGCSLEGRCLQPCAPVCDGKQCGDDGCGAVCGLCAIGESCDGAWQCVPACLPTCDLETCGQDDGCGEPCGCGDRQGCQQALCVFVDDEAPFAEWSLWRSACTGQLWARWTTDYDFSLTRLEITRSDNSGWALTIPGGLPFTSGDEAVFGVGGPGRVLDAGPVYAQPTIDDGSGERLLNTLSAIPEPVIYRGGARYQLRGLVNDPVDGLRVTVEPPYDGAIWGAQLFTLPEECQDVAVGFDPMVEFAGFTDVELTLGPTALAAGTTTLLVLEGVDATSGQLTYGVVELVIP